MNLISVCEEDKFYCPGEYCIKGSWECDGMNDCDGGEDEENCGEDGKDIILYTSLTYYWLNPMILIKFIRNEQKC